MLFRSTPWDYDSIKGIVMYHNNIKKDTVSESIKFVKDNFGGEQKEKGERVFLVGSKEIYSAKDIGRLAKQLEAKFSLKAYISIEFADISEEERKKSGLADAKLLPIPGKH